MTNDKIPWPVSNDNQDRQISNKSPITNKKYDIQERSLEFAVNIAKFINTLPKNYIGIEYSKQLARASASIGANIEEADGTSSRKDFANKMAIGRREARETRYWLRLIQRVYLESKPLLKKESDDLITESREIMLILSSIVNKTREKHPG